MTQIAAFIDLLQQDPDALQQTQSITDAELLVERIAAEAQTRGYNLKAEEVSSYLNLDPPKAEFSSQELRTVLGTSPFDFASYSCIY